MLGEVEVHKQKKGPKPTFLKEHKLASIQSTWLWTKMMVMMKTGKKKKLHISMNTQTGFEVDSSAKNSD